MSYTVGYTEYWLFKDFATTRDTTDIGSPLHYTLDDYPFTYVSSYKGSSSLLYRDAEASGNTHLGPYHSPNVKTNNPTPRAERQNLGEAPQERMDQERSTDDYQKKPIEPLTQPSTDPKWFSISMLKHLSNSPTQACIMSAFLGFILGSQLMLLAKPTIIVLALHRWIESRSLSKSGFSMCNGCAASRI
jgi:hypothetical protein